MRLINADKLIDNLDEMILADDGGDYAMGIATAIQEAGRMAFYEEVKAIPIEWIKRYIAEEGIYPNRELLSVEQADAIERMIENWEKENE